MEFLTFLVTIGVAYLIWRISDQLPDMIFRISEIQRDLAEIRRRLGDPGASPGGHSDAPQPAPDRVD
jgi:hypothetical protein